MSKRTLDVLISLTGLLLLTPVLGLLSIWIAFFLGQPILFIQSRPGYQGKPFRLIKFRSMLDSQGPDGSPLSDELRLTKLGYFLRSTSLDELPGLWNVLRGDMSLVGPRPLLMEYLSLYSPEQARRHNVRPGITGWAQINGRNAISWEEKLALDVWYVDHRTFWLDVRILCRTIKKVVVRENINARGQATVSKFTGD
jgi:lipopolysaccharide/colanic/teichoic acid biosynthesis glycosyltransferase